MKYLALLNNDGTPKAFYVTNIHKKIPDGCIEITEKQHKELSQGGKALVNGEVIEVEIEIAEEEKALSEIARLERMITPRALREAKRTGEPVKGYLNGKLYCEDVEAEIERLERDVLNRF